MVEPGRAAERIAIITADLDMAMAAGLVLCFLPAVPAIAGWRVRLAVAAPWRTAAMAAALVLLAISGAKAMTVAFHPFLYFRF